MIRYSVYMHGYNESQTADGPRRPQAAPGGPRRPQEEHR